MTITYVFLALLILAALIFASDNNNRPGGFFGWDGEKDEKGRTLLQKVGDAIRAKRPDYWVSFISDIMEFFPGEWDYVLIPDCRFPNEVDYIKNAGFDAVHLRVRRG